MKVRFKLGYKTGMFFEGSSSGGDATGNTKGDRLSLRAGRGWHQESHFGIIAIVTDNSGIETVRLAQPLDERRKVCYKNWGYSYKKFADSLRSKDVEIDVESWNEAVASFDKSCQHT